MKKKMSPRKFGGIFISITAVLLVLAIVATCVMNYWSTVMDAILYVGGPGKAGFYGIADVVTGAVNPSGRTADTYAADPLKSPVLQNFGSRVYYDPNGAFDNMYDTRIAYHTQSGEAKECPIMFVGYEEGIFSGYRFYETAAADGYFGEMTAENDPYYNRENGVVYPFGYGLSYTTFTQKITDASYKDGVYALTVEVTNTGSVAGRDVVELYVETPYTPGGVEKSKVVLAGFDKTSVIEPGASETVTITVKQEDIASYDDTVNLCYVLDAGDYTFYLGTVGGVVYGSHAWAYADADSSFTFKDMAAVIYYDANDGKRSSDEVTVTNAFVREMTGNNLKVTNGDRTMNRAAGFEASWPTSPTAEDCAMPAEIKEILDDNNYSTVADIAKHDDTDAMPRTGARNGMMLIDLHGVPYEDARWQQYVVQWTPAEMALLLGKAGFQTESFEKYGKPTTLDNDGPQAFRHQALGEENKRVDTYYMTAFPCEALLACTWDEDLLYEMAGWSASKARSTTCPAGMPRSEHPPQPLRRTQLRVFLRGPRAGRQAVRPRGLRRGGLRRVLLHQALRHERSGGLRPELVLRHAHG